MERFSKGTGVRHAAYGRGTVTASRLNGSEVRVSFGAYSLWVPGRELAVTGAGLRLVGGDGVPARPAAPERRPLDAILRLLEGRTASDVGRRTSDVEDSSRATRDARRPTPQFRANREGHPVEDAAVLESFRLGIVPVAQVAQWTVGRDDEVRRIRAFLRDGAEGAILVEGAYGAGKSHLLRYLEQDAEGLGYAVATAGFDPSEATTAFPKKAWRRIVGGFKATVEGVPLDFRGFLRAVVGRDAWREVLGDNRLLGRFLARLAGGHVEEEDWDWVEGRTSGEGAYPTLHGYSTCANMYCNLISAMGRAAVEVLGLEGLVVLLDEAEVARNVMYRYQAQRGMNFFRGLVLTANDDPVLVEEGLTRNEVVVGDTSGLIYSGHNPTRYTAGIPAHLKVAFALTPGSLQEEFRRSRESIGVIQLDVLSWEQLRDLFGRICDRFQSVTGIGLAPRDRERMFRLLSTHDRVSSTRSFIKAAIEALDYVRFYPNASVEEMIVGG